MLQPEEKKVGNEVEFMINDKLYKVGSEVTADCSLNEFIRTKCHLPGTKFMCLEGGCGTCVVFARVPNPLNHEMQPLAVNSCLVPVLGCHGWQVMTTEGLGNQYKGYHKIQKRLVAAGGTQCGYCSPGMVMSMYSLLEKNPKATMKDVEDNFGGNLCRCTGYRPILDAFKSFAVDAPQEFTDRIVDIEELLCPNSGVACSGKCDKACKETEVGEVLSLPEKLLALDLKTGDSWYRPTTKAEIFQLFDMLDHSYRIVAGNTGQGVYRITDPPKAWIDVKGVGELQDWRLDDGALRLGALLTLTRTLEIFRKAAQVNPSHFSYCDVFADHLLLVAHPPVRNIGTLSGNLMLKHAHREFQSDIFLLLALAGATIIIHDKSGTENSVTVEEFLDLYMDDKLMTEIILPGISSKDCSVTTYKIMPRAQNAHAMVNAGFKFKLHQPDLVVQEATIVYGGISESFVHASRAEQYLRGKCLVEEDTVQGVIGILEDEIQPVEAPPEPSPAYRKGLAISLFYKCVLSLRPNSVDERLRSGGTLIERPISSGKQDFDTNEEFWPVSKPVPKVEGLIQCAGEAEYSNDISNHPEELWAQLVLTDRTATKILSVDPSLALHCPGVVAFFSAKDLAKNIFTPTTLPFFTFEEKVFAEGMSEYAGQAVGLVVAETHSLAMKAADMVVINYGETKKDVYLDAKKVVLDNVSSRIKPGPKIDPTGTKGDVKYSVSGQWTVPSQYHMCMECLSCVAVPHEDQLDIHPASQWSSSVQETVSVALGLPQNMINVQVRRCGGGYGHKITLPIHTSVACALAAHKLHRPVRLVLNLERNMEWGGKRFPVFANYQMGVDEKGVVQELKMKVYQDDGYSPNDDALGGTVSVWGTNCYDSAVWSVQGYNVTTDNVSNTWCRAPGSAEGVSIAENLMDHIAHVTGLDPVEVRLNNVPQDSPVREMMNELKVSADYDNRKTQVEQFNKENRWKKKGLSVAMLKYPFEAAGNFYGRISVYKDDGTVALSTSAIEMGQGANTKAVQVCAKMLGVPVELIKMKPVDTTTHPNNFVTGGSLGSESAGYAVMKACEMLNTRLEPYRKEVPEGDWKALVNKAYSNGVDLCSQYMFAQQSGDLKPYDIYGCAIAEVLIDILTGQFEVTRMDIVEDAGRSLNPQVDIGQVEGSLCMGLGMLTTEELIHHPVTGRLLTNRTWNYKPPGAKDIPVDIRVTLKKNADNPVGVFKSKATGEPPFCLTAAIAGAMRRALDSARAEAAEPDNSYIDLQMPWTREKTWLAAKTCKKDYKLKA